MKRTIAQTPAPKKDRVYGSNVNKVNSSKDTNSAKSIKFDESTLDKIENKVAEHNKKHPNKKISLSSAKAVVRRGMGAYSSSHRPTIKGGKPNSRVAWGLARLNAFLYKIVNGESKSGKYSQDNDLIEEMGYKVSKYNEGGLIAPNGKPSNLTPEQYKLVRTPAFKEWFGDWENDPANASKVIDEEKKEPLVVYHGSPDLRGLKENYIFQPRFLDNQSFFFTDNYSMAKSYADPKRAFDYQNAEEGVMSLYLSLQNPLITNAFNQIWRKFETIIDGNEIIGTRNLIKFAKYKGYDGVIVKNVRDYYDNNEKKTKGGNLYVAFEPNQIKLADGSNTTFDGNNPDIRFEEGGTIGVQTSKLIEELKKYSNYEQGEILTNTKGEKYRYHYWKLKYRSASNWLVQLFMRASKENTGVDYHRNFAVGDYSFFYDRPEFKGQPNGSMKMRKLEVLGKYDMGGQTFVERTYADGSKKRMSVEQYDGMMKQRFEGGGIINQAEIQAMVSYINSEDANEFLSNSYRKVLGKFGITDINNIDYKRFPKGEYINPYDFSGYNYMKKKNEEMGVSFLLTGEYELVSKAIFEKDYAMWLFYNYMGRINISFDACKKWLNQAQNYFEDTMPIPINLIHTPNAQDGRSYAMWYSTTNPAEASSRIGRPVEWEYDGRYYYQEIGMVGNYDFQNSGWGTMYQEKKTGLLLPEYTQTSFHLNTLIHEFAHCLDFQSQLLLNIAKYNDRQLAIKSGDITIDTRELTELEKQLYGDSLQQKPETIAQPITNHFDYFIDSLISVLRASSSGKIPLTQLFEQQALDVQQALGGIYGDLLLEQRERKRKEAEMIKRDDEIRDNTRFTWQSSWREDIRDFADKNAVQSSLKEKINKSNKTKPYTLSEILELDNLITNFFNTEYRKILVRYPNQAETLLNNIKKMKEETNRIINNHYDNIRNNFIYGFKPSNDLDYYILNNCNIKDLKDYKSWKECAKQKV